MNEKTSHLDDKSTPSIPAPQSAVVPPTSSTHMPQNESSSSPSLSSLFSAPPSLMALVCVALSKIYFVISMVTLALWYISGMEARKAFSVVAQSYILLDSPIRQLFRLYRSRNSKKEQEAQEDDCWSSNDCFAQDIIGCCAALVNSSCAILMMIDSSLFLSRTLRGVAVLGFLVALGATVSRFNLKRKKNRNPYVRQIDIFLSSPFFTATFVALVTLGTTWRGVV